MRFSTLLVTLLPYYVNSAALPIPTQLTGNSFTLKYDQARYELGNGSKFWTRTYFPSDTDRVCTAASPCSEVLNPTIIMTPGETLSMVLDNSLGDDPVGQDLTINTFHSPNTTNLHTHGLHITSVNPGDDVFNEVPPGTTFTHIYELPSDHAGGTHWYHAHHHGSTALQAGGGAAGLLIVKDTEGDIPASVFDAPEVAMMVLNLPLDDLSTLATEAADTLTSVGLEVGTAGANLLLANGAYQPTIDIAAKTPTRVRFAFGAINQFVELTLSDAGCE